MTTKKLNLDFNRFISNFNSGNVFCALCAFLRFSVVYDVSNLNLILIFFGHYLNVCFITTFFVFNSFFFSLSAEETGLGVLESSSSIVLYNPSPLEEFTMLFLILFFLVSLLLNCSSIFTMNILIFGAFFVLYLFIRTGQKLYLNSKKRFPDLPASADIHQRTEYKILVEALILAEQELAEQERITQANIDNHDKQHVINHERNMRRDLERQKNPTPEDKKRWQEDHDRQHVINHERNMRRDLERQKNPTPEDKKKWLEEHERDLKRDLELLKNPSDQDKKDD